MKLEIGNQPAFAIGYGGRRKAEIRYAFLFVLMAQALAAGGQVFPETGWAAFYTDQLHGRATTSGELYDRTLLTCAHRHYPFGTLLKVTRLDNNKSVIVRVNDRGPVPEEYITDISLAAAMVIDLDRDGTAQVQVEAVGYSDRSERGAVLSTMNPVIISPENGFNPGVAGNVALPRIRPGGGLFGVQVGAYSDAELAERQAEALRGLSITDLYLMEAVNDTGRPIYRLIAGRYAARAQAEEYLQTIRSQFMVNGFVTQL